MSHYIEAGGRFERACAEPVAGGPLLPNVELWSEADGKTARKKAASKTKYACPSCGLNAWAKPEVRIVCGGCEEEMEAEESTG